MELNKLKNSEYLENVKDVNEFYELLENYESNTKWSYESIPSSRVGVDFDNELIIKTNFANSCDESKNYILNKTAKLSFQQRAGIAGSTLGDLTELDWTEIINVCLPYKKADALFYEVGGRVYATHSSNYVKISLKNVFNSSIVELKKVFPKIKFLNGLLTHDFMFLDFSLSEHEEIIEAYEKAIGHKLGNAIPSIKVVSSNTGKSGANIYPTLHYNVDETLNGFGTLLNSGIMLEHKGKATIDKFSENLKMSHSLIYDTLDNISKLATVNIRYPINCFLNIAQRLQLPKLASLDVANDLSSIVGENGGNGRIIYLALIKLVENYNGNVASKFALSNIVTRALTLNMHSYDTSRAEWLKETSQQSFFVAV